jgi:hypothetical protein
MKVCRAVCVSHHGEFGKVLRKTIIKDDCI